MKSMLTMPRCNFHPEVLACGKVGVNDTECLNVPQIANLKGIYEPWWESNNTKIFDGLSPGGEAGYGFLFNGLTPQFGAFPLSIKNLEFSLICSQELTFSRMPLSTHHHGIT